MSPLTFAKLSVRLWIGTKLALAGLDILEPHVSHETRDKMIGLGEAIVTDLKELVARLERETKRR